MKRNQAEDVIKKVREGEAALGKGIAVEEICRQLAVSEATWHRWRHRYGGLTQTEARRLRVLEVENTRLKSLVAQYALDKEILQEALRGKS